MIRRMTRRERLAALLMVTAAGFGVPPLLSTSGPLHEVADAVLLGPVVVATMLLALILWRRGRDSWFYAFSFASISLGGGIGRIWRDLNDPTLAVNGTVLHSYTPALAQYTIGYLAVWAAVCLLALWAAGGAKASLRKVRRASADNAEPPGSPDR